MAWRPLVPLLHLGVIAAASACAGDDDGDGMPDTTAGSSGEGSTTSGSTGTPATSGADTTDGDSSGLGSDGLGSDDGSETAAPELPDCPVFARGVSVGDLEFDEVGEASGLAVSRTQPGVLWTHNDSGDSARLFALSDTGAHLGQFTLQGAAADDWEDIALGPGPDAGVDYLHVADIGDNRAARRSVTIYRVAEPDVSGGSVNLTGVDTICVEYPDGAHDAESMMVDPQTGDLVIITKTLAGTSFLFGVPAPLSTRGCSTAQAWGELTFGVPPLPGSPATTAGDISDDGRLIAIRSYTRAFMWRRVEGQSVQSALAGEACDVPLAPELQGEALGIAPDAAAYFTVTEGSGATLFRYDAR
ncbi:MAG: hypothetical protein AAF721_09060 [Myxococcota bacterium]